jgi:hypothetical protein
MVSLAYLRSLVLLSFVLGFALMWMTGVRNLVLFPVLWAATGFIILVIAVRFAPYVVPPRLVTSNPEQITTLGLGGGETHPD